MMITNSQRDYLTSKARFVLIKLKEYEKGKEEWRISIIQAELEEACGMGHSIALDEVRSTPWEYLSHPILTDAARNYAIMNGMAAQGWELQFVSSGWHLWRRRKAVAEIAAKEEEAANHE
jgi:hypothetical protein